VLPLNRGQTLRTLRTSPVQDRTVFQSEAWAKELVLLIRYVDSLTKSDHPHIQVWPGNKCISGTSGNGRFNKSCRNKALRRRVKPWYRHCLECHLGRHHRKELRVRCTDSILLWVDRCERLFCQPEPEYSDGGVL
jgi:hypothetical protein